jgi:MFS transporter, DHA2 family, multidrug resistance protein
LMQRHVGPLLATRRAYSGLQNILNNEATLWGYIDDFRYLAILCAGCAITVMLLKKTAGSTESAG